MDARFQQQGHSGKARVELIGGKPPSAKSWIDDLYKVGRPPLDDEKVVELPVDNRWQQHRTKISVWQRHRAHTQFIGPCGLCDSERREAIATNSTGLANLS